jgi:hypothetical protein
MSGKVIYSHYDEFGSSFVEKAYPTGSVYAALVVPDEEDEDIANRWDGIRFAECKCDIQYAKERYKNAYQRYLGALHMYNTISRMPKYKYDAYLLEDLERQVKIAKRDAADLKDLYLNLKSYYPHYIEQVLGHRRIIRQK